MGGALKQAAEKDSSGEPEPVEARGVAAHHVPPRRELALCGDRRAREPTELRSQPAGPLGLGRGLASRLGRFCAELQGSEAEEDPGRREPPESNNRFAAAPYEEA